MAIKFGGAYRISDKLAPLSDNEKAEYRNRLDEINERRKELKIKVEKSQDKKELVQLGKEIEELNEEASEIREKTDNDYFGGKQNRGFNPLNTYLSGKGEASNETFMGGENIITRSQNLSDLYPNKDNLNLGKYVRGAITGNWNEAEKEQQEFRSLTTATSNVLIPQVLSSRVIDLARAASILFQGGAPLVPMGTNNMTISRIKTDPQFEFKAEGEATTEKSMEFEAVELKAKTVYGLMSLTLEALESSSNLEQIVLQTMSESIARTIDKACLYGDGVNEPTGILTDPNINTQAETEALSGYAPFIKAIGKVRKENGNPTDLVVNATTDEQLNLLVDSNGNPLATPKVVDDLNRLVSNQLPADEGTNTDESTAMVYDPSALLIGMQNPIRIEVSKESSDAFQKGLVYIRVYAMLDIAILRPKHITKITGLKESVEAAV